MLRPAPMDFAWFVAPVRGAAEISKEVYMSDISLETGTFQSHWSSSSEICAAAGKLNNRRLPTGMFRYVPGMNIWPTLNAVQALLGRKLTRWKVWRLVSSLVQSVLTLQVILPQVNVQKLQTILFNCDLHVGWSTCWNRSGHKTLSVPPRGDIEKLFMTTMHVHRWSKFWFAFLPVQVILYQLFL